MRRNYFGIGLMAFASMFLAASCSDDEEDANISKNSSKAAYINVSIATPGDDTRAESFDEDSDAGTFEIGTTSEQAINSAIFVFFDAKGQYVSKSEVSAINGESAASTQTGSCIEFKGVTTVLVNDYNPSNIPTTVVTIINASEGYTCPEQLSAYLPLTTGDGTLRTDGSTGLTKNAPVSTYKSSNGFIMTTSSYTRKDGDYYVTKLKKDNFFDSEEAAMAAADDQIVDIYVERLAAKVEVKLDDALAAANTITYTDPTDASKTRTAYQIGTDDFKIIDLSTAADAESKYVEVKKPLYSELISWGINAQPTMSYLLKHIDPSWTSGALSLGFDWDMGENGTVNHHRSYWGKAYPYDNAEYKYYTSYKGAYDNNTRANGEDLHMVYLSANQLTNELGASDYCPENTNSATSLNDPNVIENFQAAVTCVLIKARLVDATGAAQKLIYFNNQYWYTVNAFKQMIIDNSDNIHKGSATGSLITADDVELTTSSNYNGAVYVTIKASTLANSNLYDDAGTQLEEGSVNSKLRKLTTTAEAIAYGVNESVGGDMYYSIPIEHMRGTAPTKQEIWTNEKSISEGDFGVVRNHIYKLTVNSILNPGHGIFRPDEPIIPPVEDQAKYYVGVKINILSWKPVNQSVTL